MYKIFLLLFISPVLLFAQDIIFEKNYDISFEHNNYLSQSTSFHTLPFYECLVNEDNELMFVFENYYNTETLSELTFPSIAKINKNYQLEFLTEIRKENNIVNYFLQNENNQIKLRASICTKGKSEYGWSGCHPAIFTLDKSGKLISENFNVNKYSLNYYPDNFLDSSGTLNIVYTGGKGIIFDKVNLESFELIQSDTIFTFPKNSEGKVEYYFVSEWQNVDDSNIIIHGSISTGGGSDGKNFVMIYNKTEKSYKLLNIDVLDTKAYNEYIFLSKNKIILYQPYYIIILDRGSIEPISHISNVQLGFPNSKICSIDLIDDNNFLIGLNYTKNNKVYYTVLKTDLNFNISWQKELEIDACDGIQFKTRYLSQGKIAFAYTCNDSLLLKIILDKTVNVEDELKQKENFKISPNPATDFIEIKPIEGSDIQIFDMLGVLVAQTSSSVIYQSQTGTSDPLRIDISFLSPGIYFIKIGNKVEKFVKL